MYLRTPPGLILEIFLVKKSSWWSGTPTLITPFLRTSEKGHVSKNDQLNLKCYKLRKLDIAFGFFELTMFFFNIMWKELQRNRAIIANNTPISMIPVYVETVKKINISFVYINFSKLMLKILRKLAWLGGLYIIMTIISKKMFLITFGEKKFPCVTNITSNVISNTFTVSVSIKSK